MKNIIAATILGVSAIITAKILASSVLSAVKCYSESPNHQNANRYQMEIVNDHGANWNGIYVFDKQTGRVKFYVSNDAF